MTQFISFIFISLVLLLSGCDQQQMWSSNGTQKAKPFNLEKVKQQYADVPLTIIDISEQDYNNGKALAVTLSTPLNPAEDFQNFFRVSTDQGQLLTGSWELSASGLVVYYPSIEPATNYIVDVLANLTAATGVKLATARTEKIKTRDMQPQLRFASKGSVLPAKLAKGLPVITTNINEVDVDFHKVKSDKINHFLQQWQGRQEQGSYYLEKYKPFTELVYTGRFNLNPPKNTRHTTHLDLASIKTLQQPGIYLAVMREAGTYTDLYQSTYFVVSDLGIHARIFADKMSVFVSSLNTGEAVNQVEVTLYDAKENELDKKMTDKQGQVLFDTPSHKARLLVAKDHDNISILRLNSPTLDLSEFKVDGRKQKPIEVFTYGPRDIYRPSEVVKFSAILRDFDANKITAPPLKAVVKRPDGQKIKYFTWYPETDGYYEGEYQLASNAMTGNWTLELESTNKLYHQYKFKVEAFLPERMELLLGEQPPKELWTDGFSNTQIAVSGQYLYGAPASGNRLGSKVLVKTKRQPLEVLKDYYFGLEDEKPPVEYYELKDIKLDEKGLATLNVASRWKEVKNTPLSIKVISSLFESGGRPVTRSVKITSWPQHTLIGIRPHTKLEDIPDNTEIGFDIVKADSKAKLYGDTEVLATLIKERRDYYWEYSHYEGWHSEYTQKNYTVFEKRLTLDAKKPINLAVPVEWGSYLLVVKDIETGQSSSVRFHAGSGWYDQENNQSARPERVVLELDKKSYKTGDNVKLKITPPYEGNGFIVVENSQQQLWFQRVTVAAKGMVLDIPVNGEWNQHDIYVSAVIFKAGDSVDSITPNRAVGLVHLPLDRSSRQLDVSIENAATQIRPETTLTTTIKINNAKAGEKNYVTLAAVDVGVLNITNFKTPNPYAWFFEPRRYSVDQRDMYNQIIALLDGGVTKARFGGDADQHAGGARPDSDVQIVSLFSGLVETNENGEAQVDLEIPDFNGRLRLMTVAFNDNQYGANDAEITVAAPVIAETSLPRFLAAGDKSTLTLDLRNQSGEKQNLSLEISATEPVTLNDTTHSIVLADNEKKVLSLPISAEDAFGQSKIYLQLKNAEGATEKIDIKRQWAVGVRPAYPAEVKVSQFLVTKDKPVNIKPDLESLLLSSANSQLNIGSRPPINLKQHLKSLLHYPYGCLEQTISSTYPWLNINEENLTEFGLDKIKIHNKPIDLSNKTKYIERGISKIAGMQRSNGSFGLWSNNDEEEHWLTAYAVDFLLDAKQQGASVPNEMLDKALNRLLQYINHRGQMYNQRYSEAPQHYSFAYKAYAAYVLSRVNRAPLGSLRTLFDHHRQHLQSALPLTHLGIALYNQGDKVRGKQAISESLVKPRPDYIYLSDYGSRVRDLAQITYLLLKHPTTQQSAGHLIFQLSDELAQQPYLSTQELNALFHAGLLLNQQPQKTWQGELILDQINQTLEQNTTHKANFIADETPKNIEFNSQSEQFLYLQYSLQAYPKKAPKMQMDDIQIERQYYNLDGQLINPERIESGEVLLVHLNITSKKRIKDALVIDLVPAGLELENQNLDNVIKIDNFKIGMTTIADMQNRSTIKYQEYLDDRYIAAIDLYKNYPQHVFYLVRAVTKGRYVNPPPYVEDMYRPYIKAIGRTFADINIY